MTDNHLIIAGIIAENVPGSSGIAAEAIAEQIVSTLGLDVEKTDAEKLTEIMTKALGGYQEVVEVAAGVMRKAIAEGFSHEAAESMGHVTFMKTIGVAGS